MPAVTVKGITKNFAKDEITAYDVAAEFQQYYDSNIILCKKNNKLCELTKKIREDCTIDFLTLRDKPGLQTYCRSVILMLLKAFYEEAGHDKVKNITVECSAGNGIFIIPEGDFDLSEQLLENIKLRMMEYVHKDLPIVKRRVNTDKAIEIFTKHQMYDKARLFHYRNASTVNIYSLGGFEDYFYGYMVKSCGCLKLFDLKKYDIGFLLLLPTQKYPDRIEEYMPQEKLFSVLMDTRDWSKKLHVENVGMLNQAIAEGKMNNLILMQEAFQEKRIGQIAEMIVSEQDKKFVMISGPSSSGKTTFSHRLSIQLEALGKKPHPIATDNYFVNRIDSPRDENGNYNYEALECLDVEQFNKDMTALLAGKTVELPRYNFVSGEREYKGDYLTLGKDDILVIEGIHCLNDKFSYSLEKKNKIKIYISALTQLNIDEHNRIPTTDGRLLRRIVRDSRTRGASAADTIRMWPSVRKGEEDNIFPYQEDADIMYNSALVYELSVLKQYAEPLLYNIPRDSEEYIEAKRLLKFLGYFLGISSENIPMNSLIREFIGGSCFDV